jgi:hypothetical protein
VVRGGSWNNNQDNARAAYRNRNNPDNRNNNLGFRVVCSSHIFAPLLGRQGRLVRSPTGAVASMPTVAGTGSASSNGRRPRFAARGEGLKMAQVSPVRTESPWG